MSDFCTSVSRRWFAAKHDFIGHVLSLVGFAGCVIGSTSFVRTILAQQGISDSEQTIDPISIASIAVVSVATWIACNEAIRTVFCSWDTHATTVRQPVPSFGEGANEQKSNMEVREDSCLVVIQGSVYDVEPFMRRHPGGRQVLENAKGLDVTDAFMSYHPPAVMERLLPGFRVGPAVSAVRAAVRVGQKDTGGAEDSSPKQKQSEGKESDSDAGIDSESDGESSDASLRRRNIATRKSRGIQPERPVVVVVEDAAVATQVKMPPMPKALAKSDFLDARRQMRNKMIEQGLFTRQPSFYVKQLSWQVLLLAGAIYLTVWRSTVLEHLLGALFMAFFWQQVAFVGHDLGHNSVTHDRDTDFFWAACLGDAIGGISMGWWKDSHDVHHIYCNSNEHDMNIQHQPIFAVDKSMFGRFFSTYHKRWIQTDAAARFLVQYQHWLYLPVMGIARFNLYAQGIKYLIRSRNAEYRWMELASVVTFIGWFSTMVTLCLGSWQERVAYLLISHGVAGLLHVQITLSHFAEETYHGSPFQGETDEWFRMQVGTTLNVDCPEWMDWFHGGLQFQIEHHLFPRMPRHNLRAARTMVKAFCKEQEIEYRELPFLQAIGRVLAKMKATGEAAKNLVKGDGGFYHSPLYAGLNAEG